MEGEGRERDCGWGNQKAFPAGLPLPALAHLVEGMEVPLAHVLLEDPRLRREEQLDRGPDAGPTPGDLSQSPRGSAGRRW